MSHPPEGRATARRRRVEPPHRRYAESSGREPLYTAGELVERGGTAGAFAVLLYVVVGAVFWSLIGWFVDHLLGTRWIVIAGAVFGASAGVYLGYLHMRDAVNRGTTPAQDPIGDKEVI